MVFNIKRVFVAMICAVFIFGSSMASTVTADEVPMSELEALVAHPLKGILVIDFSKDPIEVWHSQNFKKGNMWDFMAPPPDQIPSYNKRALGIYKVPGPQAVPCDWVYYIPLPPDYVTVLEIKGNDPDCIPPGE